MLDDTASLPNDFGIENDLITGTENSDSGMSTGEYTPTDAIADTPYSELALDAWDASNPEISALTKKSTNPTTTDADSDIDELTGCDKNNPIAGEADTLEGIWQSDGYGYVIEAKGNELNLYNVTKNGAIPYISVTNIDKTPGDGAVEFATPTNDSPLNFKIKSTDSEDIKILDVDSTTSDITLKRIDEKPAVFDQPIPNTPQANFDVFWDSFAENYAMFPLKDVDWSAVKEEARVGSAHASRSQITSETTPEELFEIMKSAIAPLKDSHTKIFAEDIGKQFIGARSGSNYKKFMQNTEQIEGITDKYLSKPLQSWANGQVSYGMLEPDTGYLRIESFVGYSDSGKIADDLAELNTALDKIFSQPNQPENLVIDIRENLGGSDALGIEIASRFTDKPYLAYTKVARNDPNDSSQFTDPQQIMVQPSERPGFDGKVAVLTSRYTTSAAEAFTKTLDAREEGILRIGENTQGVFSNVLTSTLPNGWTIGLGNELYFDGEGRPFEESKGIAPDIKVPVFTDEDLANGRDSAIEKAEELFA
jgi:hypothetical protein